MKQSQSTRRGAYLVTRQAAVWVAAEGPNLPMPLRDQGRWQTLWASRPYELPAGRVLGLRARGEEVQVAYVAKATGTLRWVDLLKVLTVRQAKSWRERSTFDWV